MNIPLVLTFIILGIAVLLSYMPIFKDVKKGGSDRYWIMAPKQRIMYYVMIPLAAIGMIVFIHHYATKKATTGLLTKKYALEIITALFLVASALWSLTLVAYNKTSKKAYKIGCSASLVVAAIASILMLAGTYEDNNSPPYVRISILALCITTVLNDAVGWNARFILHG